jgi:(R,R)-butanediol dehydrogenase/meso-butanediol dehydrogenase/diacetyl reductase
MKAVQFVEIGKPLELAEVPKPNAYPGALVFKVKACGICGSDLHAVDVPGLLRAGSVLGHEYAGEVVEIGPGVEGWNIGDRLTAVPARPCGECPECRTGRFGECSQIIAQGFDARMPGAYAEYSTCMAGLAIKIDDTLSDQEAALIEPLAVGFNACRSAKLDAGASVLVIGAGVIGLTVAKWAKFFGAGEVGISEMLPARIARAQATDADLVIDAREHQDPVREFERQTGRKPMVIFECVGRPMIANLISMAPTGAHLVLVGTGMQQENFTVLSAAMKRLRMTFPFAYVPSDFHFVQRMLIARRVTVDGLVTDTVSLDDAPEMFARLGKPNDFGKVLITP